MWCEGRREQPGIEPADRLASADVAIMWVQGLSDCELGLEYRLLPLQDGASVVGVEARLTRWHAGWQVSFHFEAATVALVTQDAKKPRSIEQLADDGSVMTDELTPSVVKRFRLLPFSAASGRAFYFVTQAPASIAWATCRELSWPPRPPSPPPLIPSPFPPAPPSPPSQCAIDLSWSWRPMPGPVCDQEYGGDDCAQGVLRIKPWVVGHTVWLDFSSAKVNTLNAVFNADVVDGAWPGVYGFTMQPWEPLGGRGASASDEQAPLAQGTWTQTRKGLPAQSTLCCWLSFEARAPARDSDAGQLLNPSISCPTLNPPRPPRPPPSRPPHPRHPRPPPPPEAVPPREPRQQRQEGDDDDDGAGAGGRERDGEDGPGSAQVSSMCETKACQLGGDEVGPAACSTLLPCASMRSTNALLSGRCDACLVACCTGSYASSAPRAGVAVGGTQRLDLPPSETDLRVEDHRSPPAVAEAVSSRVGMRLLSAMAIALPPMLAAAAVVFVLRTAARARCCCYGCHQAWEWPGHLLRGERWSERWGAVRFEPVSRRVDTAHHPPHAPALAEDDYAPPGHGEATSGRGTPLRAQRAGCANVGAPHAHARAVRGVHTAGASGSASWRRATPTEATRHMASAPIDHDIVVV